ncbi:MAG: GIY-YIG nuclease family protein [Holophagaceae bacterium]|nr:GIY-YIG nuclease family protein [Holophagaceae bacterium]
MSTWHVYILRCGDGSFYTGISPDVEARLQAHQAGKGARYTKGRGPFVLVYQESAGTQAEATRREREVKRLTREQKQTLIRS